MDLILQRLDLPTLFLANMVLYLALSGVFLHTWLRRPTYAGFLAWTISHPCWFIGLSGIFFREFLPLGLAIFLANGGLFASTYFFAVGFIQFWEPEQRSLWRWPLAGVGLMFTALCMGFYYGIDSYQARTMLNSFGCALYLLVVLRIYARHRLADGNAMRIGTWIFVLSLGLLACLLLLRVVLVGMSVIPGTHQGVLEQDMLVRFTFIYNPYVAILFFFVIMTLTVERIEQEAARAKAQLEMQARTDSLTQLGNRRHFIHQAEQAIARTARHQHPLSLVVLDLDHFKQINDTYGHIKGDEVLAGAASSLKEPMREIDLVGRMGGEEFALLLEGTSLEDACVLCERLLGHIRGLEFPDAPKLHVTASMGVVQWQDGGFDALYTQADAAMYEAKHRGRDQVRAASGGEVQDLSSVSRPA